MGVLRHKCAPYVSLPFYEYKKGVAPVPMSKHHIFVQMRKVDLMLVSNFL